MHFSFFENKVITVFARMISVRRYISLTKRKCIFPFYHIVSNNSPAHVKHLSYYVKSEKEFEKDIDFYLKHYKSESLNNINLFDSKINSNKFFLSFDDGLSECYHTIAPLLKKKGVHATFFLNSDFIDNKALFLKFEQSLFVEYFKSKSSTSQQKKVVSLTEAYFGNREHFLNYTNFNEELKKKTKEVLGLDFNTYLKKEKPYLSTFQINSLINDGFSIGAHSINHPLYSDLSLKEQLFQTKKSMKFIEEKFNINDNLFSFPFTDFGVSDIFFSEIFANKIANYTFGTAGIKNDYIERNIQRVPMETTKNSAEDTIKLQYFRYLIQTILNMNTVKR